MAKMVLQILMTKQAIAPPEEPMVVEAIIPDEAKWLMEPERILNGHGCSTIQS